jgi:hypothetical protein
MDSRCISEIAFGREGVHARLEGRLGVGLAAKFRQCQAEAL